MSNGSEECCALRICCNEPEKQLEALVKIMVDEGGCEKGHAQKAADIVLRKFALAPKSFEAVVRDIVIAHGHAKDEPHV